MRDRPLAGAFSRNDKEAADEFGALLRRTRRRKSLTQEQLAVNCNLSVRTVRRLEAGDTSRTQLWTVQRLADALGLGPDERDTFLFTASGTQVHARVADEFGVLLRQTREHKALTQEQLAERASLGTRTVRRLEAGDASGLVVATVRRLADALELGLGSDERDSFLRAAVDGSRTHRHPNSAHTTESNPGQH